MATVDPTSRPEDTSDSPAPIVRHEITHENAPANTDFVPPIVKKPSKYRYIWLVLIAFLVLSVVGVGTYIIDAENKKVPSHVNALLTPTPEISHVSTPRVTVPPLSETYTDPTLYYSFRYPKTITLATEKSEIDFTDSGGTRIMTMGVTADRKEFIDPANFESCSVVLHDAEAGEDSTCVTIDSNKINFGPSEASHFVSIKVGADGTSYDIYQTVDPALQFTLTFASGKEDGEKLFRQLLPTFIFTASPSATPTSAH